jgi:hypothetical protein
MNAARLQEGRKQRQSNRLFFGYFLKAAQKKVSRLRVTAIKINEKVIAWSAIASAIVF